MPEFSPRQKALLEEAADELDALWKLDEVMGRRPPIDGEKYNRESLAVGLRNMAAYGPQLAPKEQSR